MYGWTKKYQAITIEDLRAIINDPQNSCLDEVVYFKYITETKHGHYEERSTLKKDLKAGSIRDTIHIRLKDALKGNLDKPKNQR